jgi:uncharacterized protein with LGFP repeats
VKGALVRILTVLAVVASGLLAPTVSSTPASTAQAADLSYFTAGNIISDAVFYDYLSMGAGDVQAFLDAKGNRCTGGAMCLKNYTETTNSRAADAQCPGGFTGRTGETAATIIWKVGVACHINPRVLLVTLQKENGLVTATSPSSTSYRTAMGYGCPDTAACDTQYYGFFNQLYSAARQFQNYRLTPTKYSKRAGMDNTIAWHPNGACGTSTFYLFNQATAGLYNYTPYRPNQAALDAGYSTGDSCSSYGNRNFWNYFTDWFGSTQSPGGEAILAAAAASGGTSGPLGVETGPVRCGLGGGGCVKAYAGGNVYWSPATGAHPVLNGAISNAWAAQSWEAGALGYPIGEQRCGLASGGCLQNFRGGTMYSTSGTGTYAVSTLFASFFAAQNWENGPLGYPLGDKRCGLTRGGCVQAFQGGTLYNSPASGTHQLTGGAIAAYWAAQQWESGPLGYPIGEQYCGLAGGGCVQNFENGPIYSVSASGTHSIPKGTIATAWAAQKWEAGPAGYPAGEQRCGLADGGCTQVFQGGTMVGSATVGGHLIPPGAIADAWVAQQAQSGPLGYPVGEQYCGLTRSGCLQTFQGGTTYTSSSSGTHTVPRGTIADFWATLSWESGRLGYPTGEQRCATSGGGCVQAFAGGTVSTSTATGNHVIPPGAINDAWAANGSENGKLGYAVAEQYCGLTSGGCLQTFQGGTMYNTSTTGSHAVFPGAIATFWAGQRWEGGPLGYPVGELVCGLPLGGCSQEFQGGTVYSSSATSPHVMTDGPLADAWVTAGAGGGPLGYPVAEQRCGLVGDGCLQSFQKGTMYTSPASSSHSVSGEILGYWGAQGWEGGQLGYPVSEPYAVASGTAQDFQGGQLLLDEASGKVTEK